MLSQVGLQRTRCPARELRRGENMAGLTGSEDETVDVGVAKAGRRAGLSRKGEDGEKEEGMVGEAGQAAPV